MVPFSSKEETKEFISKCINEYECDNYISLNTILEDKKIKIVLPIYIIINSISEIKSNSTTQKLLYFLKFGYKVGIHLVIINRGSSISMNIVSNTKMKIVLKTSSLEASHAILENKNACSLGGNGDAIIVNDLDIFHVQLPFISDSDFHRVISKFILN